MLDRRILIELSEYVRNKDCIMLEEHFIEKQMESYNLESVQETDLEIFIKTNRRPSLKEVLFEIIDRLEMTETEVYKKARIDRRHFSKIRSNANYHPKKNTIISLALALELNDIEADKLLASAGYTLTNNDTFDLVIQFCIKKKIYNIDDVNLALDYFSLKPLVE